ncbi:MAG: DUF1285 domain-containing protein [Pseudomonadota bacterium]
MARGEIATDQDATRLAALISRAAPAGKGIPPVERWHPSFRSELDIEIRADGAWFYMGTPIRREALVRLFSTVLRKDQDDRTYLVTPAEKVAIRVEDAPFIAVEMSADLLGGDQVLTFRTNVGDVVEAGSSHPLRFEMEGEKGAFKPYLHVRGRLEALVSRAVTFDLAELGETRTIDGTAMFCIASGGAVFPIMPAQRLRALSQ